MKVISYNLNKHKAAGELTELVNAHDPDILCLQECDVPELPEQIGGLVLADATQSNRLGLALFYRASTFHLQGIRMLGLKKSLHDRIAKPAHERVLAARVRDIDHGRDFIVASFHAAPLTALNSLRRHQIRAALDEVALLGEGLPQLMVGDYNYPLFKESLGQTVRDHGYSLSLSDDHTYTRYRVFRGHFDFATSKGFEIQRITTLPQRSSDHMPILVTVRPD
ncbi:endonuclease/exonuclease/phosphatase family protein [Microbacterium sp. K24]|jgi:endonuclease/exonuclease/phosphatase family metal-dependent hydrolase|uniref:endonuclease/exonuclease/phosphatase family protein n=1 Tax=Microbacterium sp. K24 TaxID=2305446 RepID=UPI00109C7906|nr:endonuclease/exonuclease/phosphatase family protein [Microbacterium sp. K24]